MINKKSHNTHNKTGYTYDFCMSVRKLRVWLKKIVALKCLNQAIPTRKCSIKAVKPRNEETLFMSSKSCHQGSTLLA